MILTIILIIIYLVSTYFQWLFWQKAVKTRWKGLERNYFTEWLFILLPLVNTLGSIIGWWLYNPNKNIWED